MHKILTDISSRYMFSYVICFRIIHFILISTAHALFINPAVSEANMVDTCKHFEIGNGSVRRLSHLRVFVIEHNNDFKIVLRIKTYVSCRRQDYIIQIENRVLLSNFKKAELSLKVS